MVFSFRDYADMNIG